MDPRPAGAETLPVTGGPSGIAPGVAHPARVYDYWLGGKDHYPADREAADEVACHRPQVVAGARANRAFLVRAVRYLAGDCGTRQFLDIGIGLPGPAAPTHEIAQAVAPDCAVVYADNDPLVLAYARALLTASPPARCGHIQADLRDPAALLAQASQALDFTRPIAVLLLAVLHFLPDACHPAGIVADLVRALAPGSYVAISHLTADLAPAPVGAAVKAYNAAVPCGVTARSHAEVTALFGGLPLVAPGVVPVAQWRQAVPVRHAGSDADLYAGIARTSRMPVPAPPASASSLDNPGSQARNRAVIALSNLPSPKGSRVTYDK